MAPRTRPTQRQRRLGLEMRRLREAAGMTTEAAAKLLNVPRTNIPNMESGRSGISPDRVRTLADNYGCRDGELVRALADMAAPRKAGWWESYRGRLPDGFLDVAELEAHTREISVGLTAHLPGLLQTADHARAVFAEVVPNLTDEELEARVSHRLERQRTWLDGTPRSLEVVLHEAALRMEFGGRGIAAAQRRHVLRVTGESDTVLRIVPFCVGGFPGAGQPVTYFHGLLPALDTIALDTALGAEFLSDEAQLAKYDRQLAAMRARALSPERSEEFLTQLIKEG